MFNPLSSLNGLPPFSRIRPEHAEPAIDALLAENRERVAELLRRRGCFTWDNLVEPIELLEDRLERTWSPVSHMNAVVNSEELRAAYNTCLAKLSEYASEIGHNVALYRAYKEVSANGGLNKVQRKLLENALRDFHLAGVDLAQEEKARFKANSLELSRLSSRFQENLLDSTHAWTKQIRDEQGLAGLPLTARELALEKAREQQQEGWMLTLDGPSYLAVMTYADDRELRREMYHAYVTRASELFPAGAQWDNGAVMEQILELRHENARILGFAHYAELSLATKMARSAAEVTGFLEDLAHRSLPQGRRELAELEAFAREQHGVEKMEAWDIGYYSEKLRQHRFDISQEQLKPYFPETRVLPGMFAVVQRLFGIEVTEVAGVDTWHPAVRFFEIRDAEGEIRGQFYLDLYARRNKRGGAWMDDCASRLFTDCCDQLPVAYLVCNFSPPTGNKPALFTHDEVQTLFHEFGHSLHHLLTQINYPAVAGINGVAWDAVELPSQFLENWCWEREALDLISGHYQTGEPIPAELFAKMRAAKNFQSAMQMLRQLEFALFDLRLHRDYDPARGGRVYEVLDRVRDQVAVVKPPPFNRFPHGFSHVFAGGYAAGYYSYKWAEVLSADAFSRFEEAGVFDADSGRAFLSNILERGGSEDPMDLFVRFRGREPRIDALLRHTGIAA